MGALAEENKVPAKSAGHTEVIGREENISLCILEQMNNGNTLTEHVSLTGLQFYRLTGICYLSIANRLLISTPLNKQSAGGRQVKVY